MAQIESNQAFRQFQAARAMARIDIDPDYELSPELFIPTSGTTVLREQPQLWHSVMVYASPLPERMHDDKNLVSASVALALTRVGDRPSKTDIAEIDLNSIAWTNLSTVNIGAPDFVASSGETFLVSSQSEFSGWLIGASILGPHLNYFSEPTNELQTVIDHARGNGLQEVAGRLEDLAKLPLDDDDAPLQAESARNFVEYFIARQKKGRPLMTVTPAGDLDATWKGADGESVTMRFFSDGRVWVAYKLSKERGSFERAAADLRDSKLRFRIPDWA